MSDAAGFRAAELLILEADSLLDDCRYTQALVPAERAVALAEELDDPTWLISALSREERSLRLSANFGAALVRSTRILAMAEDPITGPLLNSEGSQWTICQAYINWLSAAQFIDGIPHARQLDVIDAADRWLRATGHRDWSIALLSAKATVYNCLGDLETAVLLMEEYFTHDVDLTPGYAVWSERRKLGNYLMKLGRYAEAEVQFHLAVDHPAIDDDVKSDCFAGLAVCALKAGEHATALRHSSAALRMAEQISDDAVSFALSHQIVVLRGTGRLAEARDAAHRQMEAATRLDISWHKYRALRDLVDVALDSGDLNTARHHLPALDHAAATEDNPIGHDHYVIEIAKRHQRLADLEASTAAPETPPHPPAG